MWLVSSENLDMLLHEHDEHDNDIGEQIVDDETVFSSRKAMRKERKAVK